jgi:hypothetical protein
MKLLNYLFIFVLGNLLGYLLYFVPVDKLYELNIALTILYCKTAILLQGIV